MPGTFDLEMYRGDSYSWRFQLWADDEMSEPADLEGVEVAAQFRDKANGSKVVQLITTVEEPNSIIVGMTPELWTGAPSAGVWDLQTTDTEGKVKTVMAGKVIVTPDVTR